MYLLSLYRHWQRFYDKAGIQAEASHSYRSSQRYVYMIKSWFQICELKFIHVAVFTRAGLCHLHGLQPPSVHSNFKTSNVLVDENFIAKVADAGVSKLLQEAASSSFNAFKDPE